MNVLCAKECLTRFLEKCSKLDILHAADKDNMSMAVSTHMA
jgi:hypothetical protein